MSLTAILNLVFLAIAGVMAILYLIGKKETGADRLVEDPVCGAEVEVKSADYCYPYEETIYYFDSKECRDRFRDKPDAILESKETAGSDDRTL